MLGPSFSPSMARMPGPASSHIKCQRFRCLRAWCTRVRSCDRASSSSVSGGMPSPGGVATSVLANGGLLLRSGSGSVGRHIDLDAHRLGQLAADGVLVLPEQHERRAAEGLAVTYREAVTG